MENFVPYVLTREKNGVYKKFSGFVTPEEFLASIYENHRDPDYDRLRYSINDFLEVTDHAVSNKDVLMAAAHGLGAAFLNATVKVAIVTTNAGIRDLVGGFAALTKYPLAYFTDVASARLWLQEP